jgi:hypothetical protein
MSENQLHTGVWVRQILKGKRKVRISFIPDDLTCPSLYTVREFDEGEKSTWVELLGDPKDEAENDIDIDAGVTLLRFNQENTKCNATWLPSSSNQKEIFHEFIRPEPAAGDVGSGGAEYRQCMANNAEKSFIEANAVCLGQWLV